MLPGRAPRRAHRSGGGRSRRLARLRALDTAERAARAWAAAHREALRALERGIALDGLVGADRRERQPGSTSLVAVPLVFRRRALRRDSWRWRTGEAASASGTWPRSSCWPRAYHGLLVCSLAAQPHPLDRDRHAGHAASCTTRSTASSTGAAATAKRPRSRCSRSRAGARSPPRAARTRVHRGPPGRRADRQLLPGVRLPVPPGRQPLRPAAAGGRARGCLRALRRACAGPWRRCPTASTLICGLAVAGEHGESKEELLRPGRPGARRARTTARASE